MREKNRQLGELKLSLMYKKRPGNCWAVCSIKEPEAWPFDDPGTTFTAVFWRAFETTD